MNSGLSEKNELILSGIISKYIRSGSVVIYGSRAKGDFTERSDVDIAIKNCQEIDDRIVSEITDEIDESDFPYLADIQIYENIKNSKLRDHIDRAGIVFLSKDNVLEK